MLRAILTTIATLISSLTVTVDAHAQEVAPLAVYVSTAGNDNADGQTPETAKRTLQGAHSVVCPADPCAGLGHPVEIRIKPGIYPLVDFRWRYFDDTHPTRFMPADYQLGDDWTDVAADGGRPVLDGQSELSGLMLGPDRESSTGRTNFEVHYLEFRNYIRLALHIEQGTPDDDHSSQRITGNLVYGNLFHHIGNQWQPTKPMGYTALWLGRADQTVVRNNHFVDIINEAGTDRGHEHGIYMWNARGVLVQGNRFERVGGAPVRVRQQSAGAIVEGNMFKAAGDLAYISDWYCTPPSVAAGRCGPVEYRTYGVKFRANTLQGLYVAKPGARVAWCHDMAYGACPAERISVEANIGSLRRR